MIEELVLVSSLTTQTGSLCFRMVLVAARERDLGSERACEGAWGLDMAVRRGGKEGGELGSSG